jgi:hypothetical protein
MPTVQIARLKVTLEDIRPPIWRRVEVPLGLSFAQLSDVVLAAFGWTNSHLHEFELGERRIGMPDPDEWVTTGPPAGASDPLFDQLDADLRAAFTAPPPLEDEATVTLAAALDGEIARFLYRYDFGDDWCHAVELEALQDADPSLAYPRCIAGQRSCPPEDCGGLPGYEHLLAVLADPSHEEHAEMRAWCPSFEPEEFDLAAADAAVRDPQSYWE